MFRIVASLSWWTVAACSTQTLVMAQSFQAASEVLRRECISCHGTELQMGGLRLDRREDVLGIVDTDDAGESLLIQRIVNADMGIKMPPSFDLSTLPQRDVNTLKLWIEQGAQWPENTTLSTPSISSEDSNAMQQLWALLRNGKAADVRAMLKTKPDLVHAVDHEGWTPLHAGCIYGDAELVRELIAAGADVDARDPSGLTPLMLACHDLEITDRLLKAGADATAVTQRGRSALEIAASYSGNLAVLDRLLASQGAGGQVVNKALQQSVRLLDREMVQRLIAAGGRPSERTMYFAGRSGDMNLVQLLIESAAARQRQTAWDSALRGAAIGGSDERVTSLLKIGAHPAEALVAAAYSEFSRPETVRRLLDAGADPRKPARVLAVRNPMTAVDVAIRHGNPEVIRLLENPLEISSDPELPKTGASEIRTATDTSTEDRIRTAVAKSIALLQPCDKTFFLNTGCIGCHQQSVTALAVAEARRCGLPMDDAASEREFKFVEIALKNMRSRRLLRLENPFAQPATVGLYALAFHAQGYKPDVYTDAMVMDMAGRQTAEGSWVAFTHRPPIEFSKIKSTAFAIKAMQLYGPPSHRERFERQIQRGQQWLLQAKPHGNEEEVFRLLGLVWSQADKQAVKTQITRLLESQQANGGWQQLPYLETDAYATSMAMYGLYEAGLQPDTPVFQKAIGYLLSTQQTDGSWHVKSRSQPVQSYFESGFPHGTDQWISATATGWASVMLLKSLPH